MYITHTTNTPRTLPLKDDDSRLTPPSIELITENERMAGGETRDEVLIPFSISVYERTVWWLARGGAFIFLTPLIVRRCLHVLIKSVVAAFAVVFSVLVSPSCILLSWFSTLLLRSRLMSLPYCYGIYSLYLLGFRIFEPFLFPFLFCFFFPIFFTMFMRCSRLVHSFQSPFPASIAFNLLFRTSFSLYLLDLALTCPNFESGCSYIYNAIVYIN